MSKKIIALIFCLVLVFGLAISFHSTKTEAQSSGTSELDSWFWSDNIGWISTRSGGKTNTCDPNDNGVYEGSAEGANSSCPSSGTAPSYRVTLDSDGTLSGYGWSDSVGWISFNESSGCPVPSCQPKILNNRVTGWARALTAPASSSAGGWDGWISLGTQTSEGIEYGAKVSTSGNSLSGYSWGELVVGWNTFAGVFDATPNVNGVCSTTANQCTAGTIDTSPADTSTQYNWDCTGSGTGATAQCSALIPISGPTGSCSLSLQTTVTSGVVNNSGSSCRLPLIVINDDDAVRGNTTTCASALTCWLDSDSGNYFSVTSDEAITKNFSIGSHTLTCTNGTETKTFSNRFQCRLNPSFGEF